jgi:hypothetical protein
MKSNDEARMTNDETMTKPEFTKAVRRRSNFAIRAFLRHSTFVIRHFVQ